MGDLFEVEGILLYLSLPLFASAFKDEVIPELEILFEIVWVRDEEEGVGLSSWLELIADEEFIEFEN